LLKIQCASTRTVFHILALFSCQERFFFSKKSQFKSEKQLHPLASVSNIVRQGESESEKVGEKECEREIGKEGVSEREEEGEREAGGLGGDTRTHTEDTSGAGLSGLELGTIFVFRLASAAHGT
jgi:hypothetical protein